MNGETFTIALAGNPNSGKTTLFNAITGSRRHVGNYPGVTVDKEQGTAERKGAALHVVDLPGTYSLTAYSVEEVVARNFIMDERPDVVVDIIDSSNLERNLYLAIQLIECGVPLVLALNMFDVARGRGWRIDVQRLSKLLGVPIVATVAHKAEGLDELLDAAVEVARNPAQAVAAQRRGDYGHEIEPHLKQFTERVADECRLEGHQRWFAIKLLENDAQTVRRLKQIHPHPDSLDALLSRAKELRDHIEKVCGDSVEIIFADRRYGMVSGACTDSVRQGVEARHARSDRIDAVLTDRYLGLPIFAVMMFLVFQLTFALGNPLVDALSSARDSLAEAVRTLGDGPLVSLLADGVIEGVGAVLSFVPLILLLYLAIAILEDSGYMARAAFVLDKLMHKVGLHGKSFIPMLIGFGCTVPAVLATRILETRRDRLTTIMVLPLISCGARLPIYVLILGAFFPSRVAFGLVQTGTNAAGEATYLLAVTNQALLLFGVYAVGILLAVGGIKLLRTTIFRGEVTPFLMELPPYRMPALRGLLVHMWERTSMYIRKAGTVILAIVIILWAMKTWPALDAGRVQAFEADRRQARVELSGDPAAQARRIGDIDRSRDAARLDNSAIGRLGRFIAPVMAPCGFDWKISTAILGAGAAKEVFVGQMGLIYAVGADADESSRPLREKLRANYSPLTGLCIMLFMLIATPCVATVAVTFREASWKWAVVQWTGLTVVAWILTAGLYQAGRFMGY